MSGLLVFVIAASSAACPYLPPHFVEHASRHYTGLLSAPSFFVQDRCNGASPFVDVFSGPSNGSRIAQLRWVRGSAGSGQDWWCQAVVYPVAADGAVAECPRDALPLMEYGYEEPGFIVLEQSKNFARIRLDQGEGWVRKEAKARMYPYESLVVQSLPQMARAWDGKIFRKPGGAAHKPSGASDGSIELLDTQRVNGRLWFKVRLLDHSPCSGNPEPSPVDAGWVPAYDKKGDPLVTYSPRGC
jgi:hypothetical protein